MGEVWGADIDQLRSLAGTVRERTRALETARAQVEAALEGLDWFGQDSDGFHSEWAGLHRPGMSAVIDTLTQVVDTLEQNADDQADTSDDAGTEGPGPGTWTGTGTETAAGTGVDGWGSDGSGPVEAEPASWPGTADFPTAGVPSPQLPTEFTPDEYLDLSDEERDAWLENAGDEQVADLLADMEDQGLYPGPDAGDVANEHWTRQAAQDAGIDYLGWDPDLGADANRENIEAVYEYYADLYLQNPDLQWAGMAAMIGPSFAAGFLDLDMFRDVAQGVEAYGDIVQHAPDRLVEGTLIETAAGMTDAELRFYETTFLEMQREIFQDQASMHAAYEAGGMEEIQRMYESGAMPEATYDAWADIDSGDPERISDGNVEMLRREQQDIIHDDYQDMMNRPGTGEAMTYMMTLIGEASIPGTQTFAEVNPLTITTETPGTQNIPFTSWDNPLQGEIVTTTPLPDGNIADTPQRWDYIQSDTLPAYQDLLANDPGRVEEILRTDVSERIDEYRLTNPSRLERILDRLGDGDIDVKQ